MNEANWRKYQHSLNRGKGKQRSLQSLFWSLSGLVFVLGGGFSALSYFPHRTFAHSPVEIHPKVSPSLAIEKISLSDVLEDKSPKSELTISKPIQDKLDHLFRQYKVDWAAAAVIDAKTGAILALSSHSEKDPAFSKIAFNAMYPAASVFKVVTSAAAMDQNLLNPQSEVAFTGDSRFVAPKELANEKGAQTMSLEKAFANSANKIFGRVAAYKLSPEILIDYAQRFGFNQIIPSDVPMVAGQYHLASNEVIDLARTGAGFGDVTLSPIHAALMAAAISNHGQMMQPKLIQASLPKIWRQVIPQGTAEKMKELMRATISEGTAHKSFRHVNKDSDLASLDMGGKTGTLTGTIIPSKHEWFMGYASHNNRQLALGIVIVNDKTWKVKPSFLAKEVFSTYFNSQSEVAQKKASKGAGRS